jgi:hypothetical protein
MLVVNVIEPPESIDPAKPAEAEATSLVPLLMIAPPAVMLTAVAP